MARRSNRILPPTIYDVARVAGVSASTVSRALSGYPHVAPATREAIRDAAATLRYHPNLIAQDLAKGLSQTIGLLLPDTVSPFWGRLIKGIETGLREHDYSLLMASAEGSERPEGPRAAGRPPRGRPRGGGGRGHPRRRPRRPERRGPPGGGGPEPSRPGRQPDPGPELRRSLPGDAAPPRPRPRAHRPHLGAAVARRGPREARRLPPGAAGRGDRPRPRPPGGRGLQHPLRAHRPGAAAPGGAGV